MRFAHEIMDRHAFTVTPETPVADLARGLLARHLDGAIVVDGRTVVGVVTAMDLVFQEKKVHLPTFIAFMDAMLPIGGRKTEQELAKITGATVREIMSSPPRTVEFDASLDEVATLMVEDHITVVPVLQHGVLVGMITKPDVLRAVLEARTGQV